MSQAIQNGTVHQDVTFVDKREDADLVQCNKCGMKEDVDYCVGGLCLHCQGRTCGQQKDIVVTINHSLDEYSIELVQQIEKAMDDALVKVGFTRSTSTKGKIIEFVYWQFAMTTTGD